MAWPRVTTIPTVQKLVADQEEDKAAVIFQNIGRLLRACEKIPSRLRAPLNMSDCVAGPPISGHVELATLANIGTPAPCQTRPEAPSLRAGIFSQALRNEPNDVDREHFRLIVIDRLNGEVDRLNGEEELFESFMGLKLRAT